MNESTLLASPSHRWLADAISRLPEAQRIVLVLFHFERLDLSEIAMLLDESEDDVAAQFFLANEALGMVRPEAGAGVAELLVA